MKTHNLAAVVVLLALLLAHANELAAANLYASQTSTNPTPPFATWDTAAHTIQEAVDAASDGDTVWVGAGAYRLTNQVTIAKGVLLRSDAGVSQTILDGQFETRCLWISNSLAVVDGFTMTWGRERDGSGLARGVVMIGGTLSNCIVKGGGGPPGSSRLVHCTSGGLITDCHIGPNVSFPDKGGGVYLTDSELRDSTISGMFSGSQYGGAYDGAGVYAVSSTISGCTITGNWARRAGGGAYFNGCEVDRCIVSGNTAGLYLDAAGRGGGVFATNSVIRNSLIAGNYASSGYDPVTDTVGGLPGLGGGIYLAGGRLLNCTATGNRASQGGGTYVETGNVRNSIIYFNTASSGTNWHWNDPLFPIQQLQLVAEAPFTYSCTTPDPGGVGLGNIVEDPQFVDRTNGNYRLAPTSPCVDAGTNEDWMLGTADLDGDPRIHNGTVDMGAWESTNAPPSIVNPPQSPVQFTPPQADNGVMRSMIEGLPGQVTLIIESSIDLIEWQPIRTNTVVGDTYEFVEPISPDSQRQFFRALIRN